MLLLFAAGVRSLLLPIVGSVIIKWRQFIKSPIRYVTYVRSMAQDKKKIPFFIVVL